MNWRQALLARLTENSPVMAISTGASWQIRPDDAALPWVVLTTVVDARPQTLAGFQGRRSATVQIDAWAESEAAGVALMEAVIAALAPAGVFSGITFGRGFFDVVRDLGEVVETRFITRKSFDLQVLHD